MKKLAKKNLEYIIYVVILLAVGIAFFFCLGEQGYILEKDSSLFLENRVPAQYLVYPVFLDFCYNLFGKENYLEWVSNIQGLLSLIVSFITAEYFRKKYRLNYIGGTMIFLCSFGPYAYSLPQYVSSHSIMTEGLTFPLFNLWMLCALHIYLKKRNRYFGLLFLITIIMAFTRPQLTLFFIISFIMVGERVIVYGFNKIKECNRKSYTRVCILIGILFFTAGIKLFFVFIQNNIYPQMTDAVAGRVFCTVEEDDANLFEEQNKELFIGIYSEIEELQSRQCYFREGIRQWEDIVDATNENTKLLGKIIRPYYPEIEMTELNDVKGQLAYTMMLEHWDNYLLMTMPLLLQSLVVSIFVHPESAYLLGYVIAILLYIIAVGSIVIAKKKYRVDNKYIIPLLIVLVVILSICVITNILFVGLQRYVVYSFGFFYISLIILFYGILQKKRIVKENEYEEVI